MKLDCNSLLKSSILISRLDAISLLDTCSSTNDYLLSRKPPIEGKFNLCVAATQTAGRGRHGKTWYSNHDGIYLSVSWQTTSKVVADGWLLLMTAVRLAESLQTLGITEIGIKWPNDLYYNKAKLAGLLFEQRGNLAVIGIGLNVATPPDAVGGAETSGIGIDKTSIAVPAPAELVALVANVALESCKPIAFDDGRSRFAKFDVLYNGRIKIDVKGIKILGIAKGIDKEAQLLVECEGRTTAYNYGEISICK